MLISIIELGHRATTNFPAEIEKGTRPLGNRHPEQGFVLFADFCPLGDVAKPIEVHVSAGQHRDQIPSLGSILGHPALHPGQSQGSGRLDNAAGVFKHVTNRRTDLIGINGHHFVDPVAKKLKWQTADLPHRAAVHEQADLLQAGWRAGFERRRQAGGIIGLHRNHPDAGIQRFQVHRHARTQPATADRNEYRIDLAPVLS